MKIFYFTSTGNGLAIAKKIGGELYSIPQVLKGSNLDFEDESIGIVFPCYTAATHKIVIDFIEKVNLKSSYVFAIMSYGKMAAGGLNHFKNLCEKNGIELSYTNQILMVDNYLPMFDMKEEKRDIPNRKISESINKIVLDINSKKTSIHHSSFFENTLSTVSHSLHNQLCPKTFASKKFTIESHCTKCGICKKVCPVNNIKMKDGPMFENNCIVCLACTQNCPQNAIRMIGEKNQERFRNEDVTLNEIIDANF